MVVVQSLSHSFDGRPVLKDIDFSIGQGEIVVIMGSSGGGKTTLLKCIAGLLKPAKGDVLVDGVSVRNDPERAHGRLGLVFQYAALFDYLNVHDNILFGVERHRKLTRSDRDALCSRMLEEVGLSGSERLMPSELSGGMRKRVGLARALALEPKVLLYDEPTSGLDPVTAYSIDQLIVETRDKQGTTSVVVSHDVSSVMRVAEKIAFLHKGDLLFFGPRDEFRRVLDGPIRELVDKARTETLAKELE